MQPQDTNTAASGDSAEDVRLARLAQHGGGLALVDATNLAWQKGPRPPRWLSRRLFAGIVADLLYGETVTARACVHISDLLKDSAAARACLAAQAADEQAHAALYGRYLDRLDVPGRVNPGLEEVYQRCLAWSGHPVALVLAFNVVLEGEALRLQRFLAERLSCPLFCALNRRILMDEARHVAFGRIYGPARLAGLDAEQRIAIYRWLRSLWWDCSGLVLGGLQGPSGTLLRALQPSLEAFWRKQSVTLMRIGLVRTEELVQVERP